MRKRAGSGETESLGEEGKRKHLYLPVSPTLVFLGRPEEGRGPKRQLLHEARQPERGPPPPMPPCVTSGRLLSLSVPQLPPR